MRICTMYAVWLIVFAAAAVFDGARATPTPDVNQLRVKLARLFNQSGEYPAQNKDTVDLRPVNEKFPHAVSFINCGGSIISPTWILTAAHCSEVLFDFVIAGTRNTDDGSGVERFVKRQVKHPRFNGESIPRTQEQSNQMGGPWDFMLVELFAPLPLNGKTIAAAKLNDQTSLPIGLNVSFAGYGSDYFEGPISNQMHIRELVVQSDEACMVLEQFDPQTMVCTKGRPPRFDVSCHGDSGSGLVDDTGRLIGVASWAEDDVNSCSRGALVVFARVSSARRWIKQVTGV